MEYDEWHERHSGLRRPGLVFGVCRWGADRLGISAFWVRLAVVLAAFWTSWWALLALYLAAAISLGRTVSPRTRQQVRSWTDRTRDGLWSRFSELERRLDSTERRYRRGGV